MVEDPYTVANSFNDYYCTIGDRTAESLPNSNHNFDHYLPPAVFNDFEFEDASEVEVKNVIMKSKITRASNDGIPVSIYRNDIDLFVPIITHLCNLSLRSSPQRYFSIQS